MTVLEQLTSLGVDSPVARLVLAAALRLFLGLEREWSQKSAGIRTFSLVSLLAAVFTTIGKDLLLAVGALLVVVLGVFLGVEGLLDEYVGKSSSSESLPIIVYFPER